MSHIFISYSKKNHDYARKLADKLLELGFDVWIDDRIDYGEEWWEIIVQAIEECGAFVILMTPLSRASKWVRREVLLADARNKPIFTLLLEGENWELFIDKQFIDVRGSMPPPKNFYTRLASTVQRKNQPGKEIHADLPAEEAATTKLPPAIPVASPNLPDVSNILPAPFDWCLIPEGKVRLEDVDDWRGRAAGGESSVAAFSIAKYPITNAQFQAFIDAPDGYRSAKWWEYSSAGKAAREANSEPGWLAFDALGTFPRVNVTWHEALAFCFWLTAHLQTQHRILLPTETQWQRAAIGDTGYVFPWGDEFDPKKCNTRESGIRQLTSVTQYPQGASPFGVLDMSGNVCEWCLNEWGKDRESVEGTSARCLRGGSWSSMANDARAAFRDNLSPNSRFNYRGFRVVALGK